MPQPAARYEFRVFSGNLAPFAGRFAELGPVRTEGTVVERYIVSRLTIDASIKIHDGVLEAKRLVAREGVLEQWAPALVGDMPLPAKTLTETIAPLLGVEFETSGQEMLTEAALESLAEAQHSLALADVTKQRTRYDIAPCRAEIASVRIGDVSVQSAAVESADPRAVMALLRQTGLISGPNVSYPCYLQRALFYPSS